MEPSTLDPRPSTLDKKIDSIASFCVVFRLSTLHFWLAGKTETKQVVNRMSKWVERGGSWKGHESRQAARQNHHATQAIVFVLKSFHDFIFVGCRNERFFSHSNPYISNVTQQCWCSPLLIFRAWATSGIITSNPGGGYCHIWAI